MRKLVIIVDDSLTNFRGQEPIIIQHSLDSHFANRIVTLDLLGSVHRIIWKILTYKHMYLVLCIS